MDAPHRSDRLPDRLVSARRRQSAAETAIKIAKWGRTAAALTPRPVRPE